MLENRHLIITGGSEGIGFATAEVAIGYGAEVVITGRSLEKLEAAKAKLGDKCHIMAGDVTDPANAKAVVEFAVKTMGVVDGALNNVGITRQAPIYELPDEEFDACLQASLYSTMRFVREESAYMIANNIKGTIVNMSSLNGVVPYKRSVPYCAAKGGVNMLSKAAAMDLAPYGIRVNIIAPGFTDTPTNHPLTEIPPLYDAVKANTPLGRMAHQNELGEAICWLLSDRSSFVNGELLVVDGGMQLTAYPDIDGVVAKMMAAQG